ncbi:hypothetical protein BJV74DRAFT_880472 [Russula compacta]|nr:hypothetical protein BJV74DRAFT_880472 [Russula compacta]
MYHSFPGMDQYFWSEIPDLPFIFPLSPTANNRSRGTPQIDSNPYDPTSTTSDENRFEESHGPYAPPCTAISTPPGKGDVSDAQQFVFGDAQSPFALDIDSFWPTPAAYGNHMLAPTTSLFIRDPPLPLAPSPPSPTDRTSFSPRSQLGDPISSAPPTLSGSVSTRGDSAYQEGPEDTAALPDPQPIQQSSSRPSKKRKTDQLEADSDDGSSLLHCCMTVKPESLARHLKSDGHKRNAGLPLDRPEPGMVASPGKTLEIVIFVLNTEAKPLPPTPA